MTNNELIKMLNDSGLGKHLLLDEHDVIRAEPIVAFAKLVAAKERDRCCSIIYGQCGSDNVAERTVREIRKVEA